MKAFTFLLCTALATGLEGQNWSPILVNEKMNFQHSDSAYISNTIWVENVTPQGNDTVFELNKIVIDCPTDSLKVLRNQPSFLQKELIKKDSGMFIFNLPNYYCLKSLSKLWDSWVFNPDSNISATVTEVCVLNVLGNSDSAKIIVLSDGLEIRLSKNFGIIKFPDFKNGGYYDLVGIQDSQYGESVMDFWDIFNFEVGDVFQYEFHEVDASWHRFEIQKFTVELKYLFEDSIAYQFHKVINGYTIDYINWEQFNYSNWADVEVCYTDSLNHPANKYNYELVKMWDDYWGFYWYFSFFSKTFLSKDSLNNLTKTFGSTYCPLEDYEIYVEINPYNDTLIREQGWFTYDVLVNYTEGLGRTIYDYWEDEQIVTMYLEGYIKNGDTVGTITPDSLLLTEINPNIATDTKIKVYPNPADKHANFQFTDLNNTADKINIEIRNLHGQLLMQQATMKLETITLNVEKFSPGIYFYSVISGEAIIQQGKLVIR